MSNASIHTRIAPDLKVQFETTLAKIGLTSSQAIRLFARRVIAEQAIPFQLNVPNAETRQVIKDADAGIGLIGPFDTVEAAFTYLNNNRPDSEDGE